MAPQGAGVPRSRSWFVVLLALLGLVIGTAELDGHGAGSGKGSETASQTRFHLAACGQSVYVLHASEQFHSFTWVVNMASIPSYLDGSGAVRAIRRGSATVDRARTRCPDGRDLAPALPRAIYDGATNLAANITPEATCFPPENTDGINVVSFGRLPYDVVAVTCTYTDRGDIWQSDIMLSDAPGLFTLDPDDGHCVSSYDLQAVMTHERGHSFGLAHVPEDSGGDHLTMSTILSRCDSSGRSLGLGDVLGLAHIY